MNPIASAYWLNLATAMLVAFVNTAPAKAGDVFSSGDKPTNNPSANATGDQFSSGPCQDPQIAVRERGEGAHAYLDTNGKVKVAAKALARIHNDPFIDSGSVCAHHGGILYFIPNQHDAQFHKLLIAIDNYKPETPANDTQKTVPLPPTRYNSISSTGCPYPLDIDPNNMSPLAPPDARVFDAEAAFQQRVTLCQQKRGYLVPGGCASVCYGEDRLKAALKPRVPPARRAKGKGIGREQVLAAKPKAPTASITELKEAVDACFAAEDAFYRKPVKTHFNVEQPLQKGEGQFEQAFIVTEFAADSPLRRFQPNLGASFDRERLQAKLTGWITRCLTDHKLMPMQDSRDIYKQFKVARDPTLKQDEAFADRLAFEFGQGFSSYPCWYPLATGIGVGTPAPEYDYESSWQFSVLRSTCPAK